MRVTVDDSQQQVNRLSSSGVLVYPVGSQKTRKTRFRTSNASHFEPSNGRQRLKSPEKRHFDAVNKYRQSYFPFIVKDSARNHLKAIPAHPLVQFLSRGDFHEAIWSIFQNPFHGSARSRLWVRRRDEPV
jgi:hypothetical protein